MCVRACVCVIHSPLVLFQNPHTSADTDGPTFHSGLMQIAEAQTKTEAQMQIFRIIQVETRQDSDPLKVPNVFQSSGRQTPSAVTVTLQAAR